MFLITSVTSVIGINYLYVDRAKNFFSKMLRFQHQGYQMKALLKVDEEYQISDIYSLDFTIFSSKIKNFWLFDTIIRLQFDFWAWISPLFHLKSKEFGFLTLLCTRLKFDFWAWILAILAIFPSFTQEKLVRLVRLG